MALTLNELEAPIPIQNGDVSEVELSSEDRIKIPKMEMALKTQGLKETQTLYLSLRPQLLKSN